MKPAQVRFYFDSDILGLGKSGKPEPSCIRASFDLTGDYRDSPEGR